MLIRTTLICLALLGTLSAPVFPAAATSEVSGKVIDQDGNPLMDVQVGFHAESNKTLVYTGKTNKRGQYFISGLFTGKESDKWVITIQAEGMVPTEMRVESRTVNRVLVDDIRTVKLSQRQEIPHIIIRPMGMAVVDFKMSPPELVAQELQGSGEGAVAGGPGAAAAQPKRDPYAAALVLAGDGDLAGSLELFNEAIKEEPEEADRRQAFAQVLYKLERFEDAEAQAKKAIEFAPTSIGARMVLYSIYVGQKDFAGAKDALAEASKLEPENLDVLKQVAFIASESGETDAQIAAYEAIVAIDPGAADVWIELGDLYHEQGNDSKSEAAYQNVIELDPDGAHRIFFNLGALRMNAADRTPADIEKAISAFRKAVELDPGYAAAHKELAYALLNTGDTAGAGQHLDQYVKLSPDASDAAQMQKMVEKLRQ